MSTDWVKISEATRAIKREVQTRAQEIFAASEYRHDLYFEDYPPVLKLCIWLDKEDTRREAINYYGRWCLVLSEGEIETIGGLVGRLMEHYPAMKCKRWYWSKKDYMVDYKITLDYAAYEVAT